MRWLVIGYGNELRGDDGLGPKLADAIEGLHLPHVEVIRRHQLTPELAEPISRAERVVFIDATVENEAEVRVRSLSPELRAASMAHASHPSTLLALARALYASAPAAWWITLPASDLRFGDGLSSEAQEVLRVGLSEFERLWRDQNTSPTISGVRE